MIRIFLVFLFCTMSREANAEEGHRVEHRPHVYINMGGLTAFNVENSELETGYALGGLGISFPVTKRYEFEPELSFEYTPGTAAALVEVMNKYHVGHSFSVDAGGMVGQDYHREHWKTVVGGAVGSTWTANNHMAIALSVGYVSIGDSREVRPRLLLEIPLSSPTKELPWDDLDGHVAEHYKDDEVDSPSGNHLVRGL